MTKAEPFEGALRVLISAADVCRRVEELAAEVAADLSGSAPVIVGILNGAAPFMMDLLRFLPAPLAQDVLYDFVDATSYSGTESTGAVKSARDLSIEVGGRPVLVVDGIVDTGQTLAVVLDNLRDQQPAWLRTCVLLDKPSRRRFEVPVDYRGFEIEDLFVVGYGMDLDGRFRGLRHIAVIDDAP
jgi:hypoxanthine phosphoribosyltransferase